MKNINNYLKSSLSGHIGYNNWMPNEKRKYLDYIPEGVETVLEVGCGLGELTWLLKNCGYKVEACDFDKVCIKKTGAIIDKVMYADAQRLSEYYPTNSFDIVACTHVLEHLPCPYEALNEIRKVTRKYVLLAVPNARYITFDELETHLFSWNSATLRNLIEKAGFKIICLSPDWVNIIPSILKLAPFMNRMLVRLFYDPFELIALIQKKPELI